MEKYSAKWIVVNSRRKIALTAKRTLFESNFRSVLFFRLGLAFVMTEMI